MNRTIFRADAVSVHRLALAAGLLVVAGLAGCGRDSDASGEPDKPASGAPSATLGSIPAGDAPLEAGTYAIPRSAWSIADLTVTFPAGWNVWYSHIYGKHPDAHDEVSFYAVVVDDIYTDPCRGEGVPVEVGPAVDDLVTALGEQPGLGTSDPVETTLGDHPATRIDLEVPPGLDLTKCRLAGDGVHGLQVWYSEPADKYLVLESDWRASVYVVDVDGERQVFVTQQAPRTSEADLAELQGVLDSIRIGT